ncbi:hypothetical protein V202x_09470 [Gimesia aquarii]|uniref:Uncharacterized protein n=1 Tax=Gimesia aquarii TaxID=2527964 RepID=A0A517WQT5_9PLAN|nr:hypothetical protein V202x_09470 [Gimesia aquarii]
MRLKVSETLEDTDLLTLGLDTKCVCCDELTTHSLLA